MDLIQLQNWLGWTQEGHVRAVDVRHRGLRHIRGYRQGPFGLAFGGDFALTPRIFIVGIGSMFLGGFHFNDAAHPVSKSSELALRLAGNALGARVFAVALYPGLAAALTGCMAAPSRSRLGNFAAWTGRDREVLGLVDLIMSSQEISAGKGHIAYWANMMATVDGVITQMTCERASRLISPVAHPTGIHYGGGRRVADGILFMLSFWAWKAGWPKVKKKKRTGKSV